ncbi:uncharacterized protein LOC122671341 [Telopea speciosissima]|uniref:uncharacterized protein LOC122671341 n=1 Tax=Telopea speciosissima TaxID=54955 RepID=UPI001CC5E75F|nr:uncharacterized protein LOC122671341 [Telopea speciosissima]XP_043724443.1 uncharacterized protein LOC122671341 [Telopea speciosissima]
MNYSADLKKSSRHQHMSRGAKEKIPLQQGSHSLKLRDELKNEKFINHSNKDVSYKAKQDRVHYKVRRDDDDRLLIPPKSLQNHQKQQSNSEAIQNDELVKYMSNLPCYLQRVEKGQNLQEKALNFGVLDWGRLEKWKYSQKQIPSRSTRNDPSTSNDSSSFTTVGSSTLSGRSHSGSSTHQKKQSHSMCSNLNSTQNDGPNNIVKSTRGSNLQETRTVTKNSLIGQQDLLRTDQFFCQNYSEIKQENAAKRKDSDPKIIPEMQSPSSGAKDYEISLRPKGKMKVPDGEPERGAEHFHHLSLNLPHNPGCVKHKNIIHILPKDCSRNSSSGISNQVEFATSVDGRSTKADRKSFSDCLCHKEEVCPADINSDVPHLCPLPCTVEGRQESDMRLPESLCAKGTEVDGRSTKTDRKSFSDCLRHKEEVCPADINSDVPHSCPLPCTVEDRQESDMKLPDSLCAEGTEVPLDSCCLMVTPDEVPTGQRKDKDIGENKPSSSAGEPFDRLDPKASEVRNRLPNHRASTGLGRLSRSFSFKECSTVPQLRSSYVTVKSGPVRSDVSACSHDSTKDKANANGKGRSSPLRRLLDPLLKPKAGNHPEPSLKKMSSHRASKSSDGLLDSSTAQSMKGNSLSSCGPINENDSCPSEKHVESMMHALMQVTVKNGLPLFTFVVDSATDVLVATMRNASTTQKDSHSWVYTMYTVREIKKKSGRWINQGTKGKGHGYASSVVGLMKVSLSQCPILTGFNAKDHFLVRKFVLFGVEMRQADEETLDIHPNCELAAIVVKVPAENLGNLRNDDWKSIKNKDLSDMGLRSCMSEGRCLCNAGENLGSEHNAGTGRVTSTVVILPSGVHSLPSDGVPSSLVDRWKSGGSCDCGGWDVGCKLRILNNQQSSENFISSKASSTPDQFDLFIQGDAQQDRPVFSLAPLKKGIYSVDFHGSITLVQAFSIGIAVVNNRKPYDLSEVSNLLEGKGSQETMFIENDRIKTHAEVEPAIYVPFPPLSPVGRV